jgi:general L-amino acid transport system substrate-binding protein
MKQSDDPVVRRLLGTARGPVLQLGLDQDGLTRAIKAAGNFAEIYQRDLGKDSPLKLERGLTALWTHGGLLYPMPIR